MNIKVQTPGFNINPAFENKIVDQLELLEKKYPRIDSCIVTLRDINSDTKQNKIVEIKMNIPGGMIFFSERSDTFELSLKNAMNNLKRRFKKYKQRFDKNKRIKFTVE